MTDSIEQNRVQMTRSGKHRNFGISLIETVTALVILGLISSGVFVVIDRCIASAANTAQRVRAFEVARENMETLLTFSSVQEQVEYGVSEKYPDIHWTTRVESDYDSSSDRMWVQAECSAEYVDHMGENQEVVLTHLLTDLSEQQARRALAQQEELRRQQAERGEDADTDQPDTEADDEGSSDDPEAGGDDQEPSTDQPGDSGPDDSVDDIQRPPNIPPELWDMLKELFE